MVESLQNTEQNNRIKVAVRLRPLLENQNNIQESRSVIRMDVDEKKVYITNPVSKKYSQILKINRRAQKKKNFNLITVYNRITVFKKRKMGILIRWNTLTTQIKKQSSNVLDISCSIVHLVVLMHVCWHMVKLDLGRRILSLDKVQTQALFQCFTKLSLTEFLSVNKKKAT